MRVTDQEAISRTGWWWRKNHVR